VGLDESQEQMECRDASPARRADGEARDEQLMAQRQPPGEAGESSLQI
jgi:hypothetical protein